MQMNTTDIAVLLILQRGGDRLLKTRRFPYATTDANTRTYPGANTEKEENDRIVERGRRIKNKL